MDDERLTFSRMAGLFSSFMDRCLFNTCAVSAHRPCKSCVRHPSGKAAEPLDRRERGAIRPGHSGGIRQYANPQEGSAETLISAFSKKGLDGITPPQPGSSPGWMGRYGGLLLVVLAVMCITGPPLKRAGGARSPNHGWIDLTTTRCGAAATATGGGPEIR